MIQVKAARIVGTFAVIAAVAISRSEAQVQPPPLTSIDGLQAALTPDAVVTVNDVNGRRVKGHIREWLDSSLVIETGGLNPTRRTIPWSDVTSVARVDSTRDGTWIGFAIGAVPGVILGSMYSRYCYNEGTRHCPEAMLVLGGLTGLAGAGIGRALDSAVGRGTVLYANPARKQALTIQPAVNPTTRSRAVSMSLRF